MNDELLKRILNTIKDELSINLDDQEYMMYLYEKIEKAYVKANEYNISVNDFISRIKLEIPTFLKNYNDMKKTFDDQEKNNDSKFGISICFQLVDLFDIAELCSNNDEFVILRNKYFESLSTDLRFQGFDFIFPGLKEINLEEINNIKNNILKYVDCITPEWAGKMRMNIDPREELFVNGKINDNIFKFDYLDKMANFARKNNLKLRLHTIVWYQQIPYFLKNARKEDVLLFLDVYMSKLYQRYSDIIYTVDVLNEIASDTSDKILRESAWKDIIGDEYYIDILRIAKKNFKNIPIAYNEYGEEHVEKRRNVMTIVNKIKSVEQKENIHLLDVIGIQSHYSRLTTDESIQDAYRDYLTLDKELQVSELDVLNNGLDDKIDYQTNRVYRTVMGTASASKVKLINLWGVSSIVSCNSKRINNFLDANGNVSIYSQKLIKCYSKKNIMKNNSELLK